MIITKTESKSALKETIEIVRYAWGNSELKTWFITKTKKVILPKGCKLLFVISGERTNDDISTFDTYPKTGDVVCDLDGSRIKIKNINWI